MKNKIIFIFLLGLGLSVLFFISVKKKTDSYFVSMVVELNSANLPVLPVFIEGTTFNLTLDLGCNQLMVFTQKSMEKISKKKFISSSYVTGMKGNRYESKEYELPEIELGNGSFINPIVGEDSDQFHYDARLGEPAAEPRTLPDGLIGWKAFQHKNLFLDLGNSKIAFCDSLSTLKKQGYDTETFAKTPLLLDRDFVECEAAIPEQIVRCFLDSGFTVSAINTFGDDTRTLDEAIQSPDMQRYPFFIGGKSFGIGNLHKLPINFPIAIDVVLGMDFFIHHFVFIDFKNEKIYFGRNCKSK